MTVDCFIFFNELDLLEIRLNVLNEVIDQFVLVEATRTFQNKPKPLFYEENKARFQKFHHKITHVIVDDYPSSVFKFRKQSAWDIEEHQRNQVRRGLINCQPMDVILLSDLDEIPDPEVVVTWKDQQGIKVFRQKNFYYFVNCVSCDDSEKWWYGSVMAHFKDFRKPQDLRAVSKKMHADHMKILKDPVLRFFKSITNPVYRNPIQIIEGGWHFGYLGGVDKIIEKIEAFSHSEYNKEEFKDREKILDAIHSGKDLFDRGFDYDFIPLDNSYPPYLLSNTNTYSHLIKK